MVVSEKLLKIDIILFQGMVEATSGTTQARASYLPGEIQWGKRFKNVITRGQNDKGTFSAIKRYLTLVMFSNWCLLESALHQSNSGGDSGQSVSELKAPVLTLV